MQLTFDQFKTLLLPMFTNPDYFDADKLQEVYRDYDQLRHAPAFDTVPKFANYYFKDWKKGSHNAWLKTHKEKRKESLNVVEKKKVAKILNSKTGERKRAIKKLDDIFSIFIRLRDSDQNGICKCISSGNPFHWKDLDCGHYINRSNSALRWNENNCHAQGRYDNRFFEGAMVEYRKNLIKKIGIQKVELLESQVRAKKKWHVFEINQLAEHYKSEVKKLMSLKSENR